MSFRMSSPHPGGPQTSPSKRAQHPPASDAHSPRLLTFTLTPPPSASPSSQICSRPSLTFSDFLNDFFWKDEVPLWIWEGKNLRLMLTANRAFWDFFKKQRRKLDFKSHS